MAPLRLLSDIHERNAWLTPDAPAVIFEGETLTYGAYWRHLNMLADGLWKLGARHQDRIALLSMNRMEYPEVYGACERAGFIMTTVNFRLSAQEMTYVLTDSAPYALIFEEQYLPIVESLRSTISVARYICIGNAPDWAESYEAVRQSGSVEGPPSRGAPDDGVLIMYTSGTTGRPKGVLRSQQGDAGWASNMAVQIGTRGNTRQLLMMPLFHAGARSQYIASFWHGGAVYLHRKFDPQHILRTISEDRITHLHLAPTMLQSVLDVKGIETFDLTSVELLLYAAAPMSLPLLKQGLGIFGNVLANGYGSTEANITCLAPYQHHVEGSQTDIGRLASVGQAVLDVDLRIVDDGNNECPVGIPGEITCRSATLLKGYWNNGPATIEALRDGWFHTGDVGYLDGQGYLFLVDRKKDMIISGGENIYCREVENALESHPDVLEAAVIGVPDEKWGESVRAIVVLTDGASLTEAALIAYSRSIIAHYKAPKSIIFTDELPRLQSGKVSKVVLREKLGKPGALPA